MKFETKAIHIGQEPDSKTGSVIVPLYQTSTYQQEAIGKDKGYEYSRTGNPTRTALETSIAALENGKYGLAFASGMAAINAVLQLLAPDSHIVVCNDLYGGTYRLLEKVFKQWGVAVTYAPHIDYVRGDELDSFERAIQNNTKLIWLETPTNPLLKIIDIKAVAKIAKRQELLVAVDNTFASPYFQRPLELGADIVVHSTTKYLGGHSDIIGGAVVTSNEMVYQAIKFYQNAAGAVPGPMDCWLVLRGLKTLAIRMREHEQNAIYLAEFLEQEPNVEKVYYPGLKNSPGYSVAKKQMDGFGGMISFEIKGGYKAVEKFVAKIKIFILAESLGGVESLVCYPPKMTHGSLSREERLKRGIKDNLLRLSVGIENKLDLKEDLRQALL
jgi:cystathionine gamma-synthase/cystathionine gamma-lyase